MEIETRPLEQIIPYAANPRRNQSAVSKVAASIKEYGFRQPIVVDEGGVVIAGHTRLLAAQSLGLESAPVHVAEGLTPQQVKAYRIADNRTSEESEWDMELLALELEALKAEGCALEPLGFEDSELDSMLGQSVEVEGLTDPDEVPEVEEPFLRSGDLLELGGHRLLCGDATKAEDVERLMDGKKAGMVFTDPPYNIDYDNIKHSKFKVRSIVNDSMPDADWEVFCQGIADSIAVTTDGCVYVCHAPNNDGRTMASVLDTSFHPSTTVIWNKDVFTLGRGKYQNKHEPIWFGWVKSGKAFTDKRDLANVWDLSRPKASKLHPTMKPIELVSRAIGHASKSGDVVFDLFLGSGSTLIACEKTGRKCYGMEIAPHYCDVIVERWTAFTGQDELILNGNPLVWSQRGARGSNV